jgi:two-component system OmpR family response regulator
VGRHKILLVDDNQELLRLLARLVEAEGWEPLPYPRGKPAVKAIATHLPVAAVVDVLLPDMLGYDVAAALRRAGIPFVFMTGIFKGGRAASEARLHHGAAGYFEKPFEAKKLLEAIRGLLPPEPVPVPPPADPGADFDVGMAVEPEEPVEAMELTGKVSLNEAGSISAVISGQSLQAAGVAASPARGAHPPRPPAAPRAPRSEPPDEGELRDNLPELITAFWLTQQTGELALQRGKVRKALFFDKGRPCYAISNLIADRFGPFLVRVGKLTSTQLELCQAAADRSQRKTGDILVEMGILRETEKLYYVAQQVKAIAYSLFAWEEGRYRLHFTDRAARESTKVDIRPAHLISRGVKKLYRPERLARLLADDDLLVPTQQPAYPLHDVALEAWEAHLLPHVNGTRTFRELVALARHPSDAVRASLWSLVALEILEKRLP